jgi:hypothetical protein
MDSDECDTKKTCNNVPNVRNVFQSFWVRRNIQDDTGHDRFLLDYCFSFLPYCGIIFYIVLYLSKG